MTTNRISAGLCKELPDADLQTQCRLPVASLAERKAAETKEVGKKAVDLVIHDVETELKTELVKGGGAKIGKALAPRVVATLEKAAARLAPVLAGISGTKMLVEFTAIFPEHGKLRADAIGRENHNLGMDFVAEQAKPGTFPAGWVSHQREHLMGPNGKIGDTRHTPHVANKVIDAIDEGVEAKSPGAIAYRDYWVANAGAGVREAQRRGVRDEGSLESARKDEPFRVAYDTDPAFREGVRAAVWQASAHPTEFAEAQKHASAVGDGIARAQAARFA